VSRQVRIIPRLRIIWFKADTNESFGADAATKPSFRNRVDRHWNGPRRTCIDSTRQSFACHRKVGLCDVAEWGIEVFGATRPDHGPSLMSSSGRESRSSPANFTRTEPTRSKCEPWSSKHPMMIRHRPQNGGIHVVEPGKASPRLTCEKARCQKHRFSIAIEIFRPAAIGGASCANDGDRPLLI